MSDQETSPETADEKQQKTAAKFADQYGLKGMPTASIGDPPSWVALPPTLQLPKNKAVYYTKFPSVWTDDPTTGSVLKATDEEVLKGMPTDDEGYLIDTTHLRILWRQCIVWPINLSEKYQAIARAKEEPARALSEQTMQMIRAYDGRIADFTGETDGSVSKFYSDIGEKCRTLLDRLYMQMHALGKRDTDYFLEHCVSFKAAG